MPAGRRIEPAPGGRRGQQDHPALEHRGRVRGRVALDGTVRINEDLLPHLRWVDLEEEEAAKLYEDYQARFQKTPIHPANH